MKRLYLELLQQHFQENRQMAFVAGPRQAGKTTSSQLLGKEQAAYRYYNWDEQEHRQSIIAGPRVIAEQLGLLVATSKKPLVVFDEIHKYRKWKQFLKGFFDVYGERCKILVTGSTKLNVYRRTGDSLMGRYFLYRLHPLSVGELLRSSVSELEIRAPKRIPRKTFDQLLEMGGFPEPFLRNNRRFFNGWQRLRQEQLIKEDIRDLSRVQELDQLEMLAQLMSESSGQLVSQTSLANSINVAVPTIKRWLSTLSAFYYCFPVRPWSKNVKRSLKKEPKYYLWDWSRVADVGARAENFVASHLLKAVHFWTDYGLGEYGLYYLRNKEKQEVDFLVTKDRVPWFLVEVKSGNGTQLSKALESFQVQTGAKHAFQVVLDLKYEDVDCFSYSEPVIVPAQTFLSQLV